MAGIHQVNVHMKCDQEKVWKCIRYFATLFPRALPQIYKKIDVIKGDSILFVHYADGWWDLTSAMVEIEVVDEVKKMLEYKVIGGGMLKYCNPFTATLAVTQEDTGSLVQWSAKPDKTSNFPNFLEDIITKTFIDLDAFLCGHN